MGRVRELETVCGRLGQPHVRLLTLTGPGGAGKTRLALAAAEALRPSFPDGAWFVNLAPIKDPELVASAVAQTLGIQEAGHRSSLERLKEHLFGKGLLLILDNFEQVLPAAVDVGELLEACPSVRIIVTSRAPLHLRWEHEHPVPPLPLPDLKQLPPPEALARVPSVGLFVQRAQAADPGFKLTAANARAVAEICVRLDGLPLAIELAAARTKTLAPPALLARLGRRLDLLKADAPGVPARHQTLRAALDWSYELLGPREQALVRRVAALVGGRSLEAVQAICDPDGLGLEALDGLAALVDSSLLWQKSQADGEPRFWMFATIREYALEQLARSGELESTQRKHAAYFLDLAERAEPELTGPRQVRWLDRLEREHDNLRAALRWLHGQGEIEPALRLAAALWRFWYVRGHLNEGRTWLSTLLDHPAATEGSAARARALNGLGNLAYNQGDYEVARSAFEESLAISRALGDRHAIARVLNNLGFVHCLRGEYETGTALLRECLAICRELDYAPGLAYALVNLGVVDYERGDAAAASPRCEESLAIFRRLDDEWGIAVVLYHQAEVARELGEHALARQLCEQSLQHWRSVSDPRGISMVTVALGRLECVVGRMEAAQSCFRESLALSRDLGDRRDMARALEGFACVAARMGMPVWAGRLGGAAEQLRRAIAAPAAPVERAALQPWLDQARQALGEPGFRQAWEQGMRGPPERVIDQALALDVIAAASQHQQGGRARQPLTARERVVASLVARGLTNRAIAERLVVSPRTIDTHVEHILARLGATTRTQIATWAALHGLLDDAPASDAAAAPGTAD